MAADGTPHIINRAYPKASVFAELEFELDGNGSDYRVIAVKHGSERLRLSAEALLTLTDVLHASDALDGQASFEMAEVR